MLFEGKNVTSWQFKNNDAPNIQMLPCASKIGFIKFQNNAQIFSLVSLNLMGLNDVKNENRESQSKYDSCFYKI